MTSSLSTLLLWPQRFVDRTPMYRLVSGSLGVLAAISIVLGFARVLPYGGASQVFALTLALATALGLNLLTAKASKIEANHESAVITALILFFLVVPGESLAENWPLVSAVAIGIMSKFTVVYKKQHLFNPAAFGAAALSFSGLYVFSWWVGNPTLFIPLLILGGLVVMKVRKWVPVLTFIGVGLLVYLAESMRYGELLGPAVETFFLSWPTLFLAFFMLTEPFTMPPTKSSQAAYGALVSFLANTTLFSPMMAMSPEGALLIGNLAIAPLRLRQKLFLKLKEKRQIATDTYEFIFSKPASFSFVSGQYLEWMLPHSPRDNKGIRRYFTIASSPTENDVRVAMKITSQPSSFKAALKSLDQNGAVIGSQLAGDFVLPKDTDTKLGFIAGGIGITPFRSHLMYMQDSGQAYDTLLYYGNNTISEIAYSELFTKAATAFSFQVVHVIAKEEVSVPYEKGYVNAEIIKRRSPDYLERMWYISGPPNMVAACYRELRQLGVPWNKIRRDFFPGA